MTTNFIFCSDLIAVAGFFLLSLAGCASQAETVPAWQGPALPALHVEDRVVVDEFGRAVLLRGVNAGGRAKLPPHLPWDERDGFASDVNAYFDKMTEWGINCIRLTIFWEAVEPTRGKYDEAYLQKIDAMVAAAAQRGVYVFIDFHQDIYSRYLGGSGAPGWAHPTPLTAPAPPTDTEWFYRYLRDPVVQEAFDFFWANGAGVQDTFIAMAVMMAGRYSKETHVFGFDLFNEPSPGKQKINDQAAWFREDLVPFYERAGAAIRRVDPRYVVLAGPTGGDAMFASTEMKRPEMENLMFAPHYYSLLFLAAQSYNGVPTTLRIGLKSWDDTGRLFNAPVLIGEFGPLLRIRHAKEFLIDTYAIFDELWMHATFWTYDVSTTLWNGEDGSLMNGDWTERTEYTDAIVRPFPKFTAGKPESFEYDPGTRAITYKYSIQSTHGAPTVLSLPERIYPKEPTVNLAHGAYRYLRGTHELHIFNDTGKQGGSAGQTQVVQVSP